MPEAAILADRSVVSVAGPESRTFLQGLISNDIAEAQHGRAIYAALLTPQGKILFDFFVAEADSGFLLDCAAARQAELLKRLTLYRLRSKVEIAARPELAVASLWNGGSISEAGLISFPDPRHADLGLRLIGPKPELDRALSSVKPGDYPAHRLELGIPDSADLPPDSVFALDAGLEELNGVSFKKGCYVGQEVTARMKHRATARRRFVIAEIAGELPAPETPLVAAQRELGVFATGKSGRALALVRLDRLAEAEEMGHPITAGGNKVSLRRPPWFAL
jgi:folate-binding protein YgfZ